MSDPRIPKRDERHCDTNYDTVVMRDIPTKDLSAMGYTCRLCLKEHLVLNHTTDHDSGFYTDLYIRCSEQCGGFVHMRVKV